MAPVFEEIAVHDAVMVEITATFYAAVVVTIEIVITIGTIHQMLAVVEIVIATGVPVGTALFVGAALLVRPALLVGLDVSLIVDATRRPPVRARSAREAGRPARAAFEA